MWGSERSSVVDPAIQYFYWGSDARPDHDQDTRLQMPNKWHIFKDGQAGNNKKQRRGLLVFSELPCLSSAGSRPLFPYFPWLFAEVAHTGFSGLVRLFKKI
jgi:hypothetical protein